MTDGGNGKDELDDPPTVLLVDDEHNIRELFSMWLSEQYTIQTAANGQDALERIDETIDVVLLDRRMPGMSGDEVVRKISDRGYSCWVVMVTAVDPDFDIVEMEFDDYLMKPVSSEELLMKVERILTRSDYEGRIREYFALATKKALLDAEKAPEERTTSDEYEKLERELASVRHQVDETLLDLDEDDFEVLFHDLDTAH